MLKFLKNILPKKTTAEPITANVETPPHPAQLYVTEFNKDYYEEHKAAGLDYLGHGYWQESYAKMVTEATFQRDYGHPFFLDIGCACGSILYGFKKTTVYDSILGIDVNEHMVSLGREHFRLSEKEIICASALSIPVADNSVTLAHSAQVFEHIPEDMIPGIISEMYRVLKAGGRAFIALDAVRKNETPQMYMGDPTHCTLKDVEWWTNLFSRAGFIFDIEAYDRYAKSECRPAEIYDPFYKTYNWSVWTLLKQ